MHRSSRSGKKGQWFLLTAIIATGAFLAISVLFKVYFTVDPSLSSRSNEDLYFSGVKEQFSSVAARSSCSDLDRNLREFTAFSEREMANRGYVLFINYTLAGCTVSKPGILLASNSMIFCQNVNAADFLDTDLQCAII